MVGRGPLTSVVARRKAGEAVVVVGVVIAGVVVGAMRRWRVTRIDLEPAPVTVSVLLGPDNCY